MSRSLRILLTAGPTREPIDAVRYISNRSSGRMGSAIAESGVRRGHELTVIAGPVAAAFPASVPRRIDVETAVQMEEAVLREFTGHDVLIMAAAVADYRPKHIAGGKLERSSAMVLELEPTRDIVAAASWLKRPDQRTVGFSLESSGSLERARQKMQRKGLDMMVYNPASTMDSEQIEPVLLYPDGRSEPLPLAAKTQFADVLVDRIEALF